MDLICQEGQYVSRLDVRVHIYERYRYFPFVVGSISRANYVCSLPHCKPEKKQHYRRYMH